MGEARSQPASLHVYVPGGGVASPWLFSRRGEGIWLLSRRTGFNLASFSLVTASSSEACDGGQGRLRPRILAPREETFLARGPVAGSPSGRLGCLGTGADKLGIGRQLLGPGASLLPALVLEVPVEVPVEASLLPALGAALASPG